MHILCTICSDLINQAESIYVTKCGHVFHHNCLAKWIARSKSCPQCRNKVTDRCMFRLYPTISNENTGDDVTTLQSRLDDAQLQLREQKMLCKEKEERLAVIDAELKKNEELLRMCEKKIVVRDSTVAALKEQLEYVKIQNRETQRLKEENESLKKNIQTMNGLQKVLNATSDEVEMMLQGYSDVKTVATFATALKRALYESESKKAESRDRLQAVKQQLAAEKNTVADLQAKLRSAEEQIAQYRKEKSQENKRNAVEAFGGNRARAEDTAVKLQRIDPPKTKAECASNMSFDDGIMEILKDTNLSSREECARAAGVLRWTLQQAQRCACSGVQLARDLLVLGVPRAHAAALAEAADRSRDAYVAHANEHGFMVNKLTDIATAPGPEGTVDVVKLTLYSDEVFTGEQNITELLVDKSLLKTLLADLKTARKKMDEIETEEN